MHLLYPQAVKVKDGLDFELFLVLIDVTSNN